MLSHPYAGTIYPVSRSATEVQGLKAYPSVADAAGAGRSRHPDHPGASSSRPSWSAAARPASRRRSFSPPALPRSRATTARACRPRSRRSRARYDMAVSGPNTEGFANIAAALCPTFCPAMDKNAGPILPDARARQRPGLGDLAERRHGLCVLRPRAAAQSVVPPHRHHRQRGRARSRPTSSTIMLDEGKTDVFLLLLEDVKSPEKFTRVAEKALRAGKPLIVGKIGQSEAGARAVASHTAALAGSHAAYRAMFERYGVIEGARPRRDDRPRRRLPRLRRQAAGGQARRHLHVLGRRRRVDGGCLRARRARRAGARRCDTRKRSTCIFRPTARRRTRSIPRRKACTRSATPTFARLVAQLAADRRRHRGGHGAPLGLPRRRSAEAEGPQAATRRSRCSCGPTRCRPTAASRSSTRPAIRCSPARSAAPARWRDGRLPRACASTR